MRKEGTLNSQSQSEGNDAPLIIPDGLQSINFSIKRPSIAKLPTAYLRALTVFVQQHQTFIDQLGLFLDNNDTEQVNSSVHTLKGTCGSLGMLAIYELALEIEADIGEKKRIPMEKVFNLQELLRVAANDSEAILAANQIGANQTTPRTYSTVYRELVELLVQNALVPTELITEFECCATQSHSAEFVQQIVRSLESFSYEEALSLLSKGE
jgi:HPt (histidine-containing phosphotransfer) domain-containing protein